MIQINYNGTEILCLQSITIFMVNSYFFNQGITFRKGIEKDAILQILFKCVNKLKKLSTGNTIYQITGYFFKCFISKQH